VILHYAGEAVDLAQTTSLILAGDPAECRAAVALLVYRNPSITRVISMGRSGAELGEELQKTRGVILVTVTGTQFEGDCEPLNDIDELVVRLHEDAQLIVISMNRSSHETSVRTIGESAGRWWRTVNGPRGRTGPSVSATDPTAPSPCRSSRRAGAVGDGIAGVVPRTRFDTGHLPRGTQGGMS
jgi:hypothetical protein